jgi:hypothetical protein
MTVRLKMVDPKRCLDLFGAKQSRKAINTYNQKAGEYAQGLTMKAMAEMGFKNIEPIETGYRRVWINGKQTMIPKGKVSGDIKAIAHRGRAVHVEVKYRPQKPDGRICLQYGDFEPHQLEKLEEIHQSGGLAFVSWVVNLEPVQLFFLQWPFPLKKRKALTYEKALEERPEYFGIKPKN